MEDFTAEEYIELQVELTECRFNVKRLLLEYEEITRQRNALAEALKEIKYIGQFQSGTILGRTIRDKAQAALAMLTKEVTT